MSMFVLSNDMLVNQLCYNCHKYLSVKPVTLNFRNVLCGRCKCNGNSVPSVYNSFADKFLFKCINHFDGCDKVLRCDQVVDHEKDCEVHEYSCLGCPTSAPKIPSYMFPYHMNKMHKKSCLVTNKFTVKLLNLETNIFIYRLANYLFFIRQQFLEDDTSMVLEVFYIGESKSEVFYQYELRLGDYFYESQKIECHHINNVRRNVIVNKMDICEKQDSAMFINIRIDFEIPMKLQNILFSSPSLEAPTKTNTNDIKDFQNTGEVLQNALFHSAQIGKPCPYDRRLRQSYSFSNWELTVSSCATKIIFNLQRDNMNINKKSTCFHCILCKYVPYYGDTRLLVLVSEPYLICNFCFKLIKNHVTLSCDLLASVIAKEDYTNIILESKEHWQYSFNDADIVFKGKKQCCFQNCAFSFDNFQGLKRHFYNCHETTLRLSADSNFQNLFTYLHNLLGISYVFHFNILICVTIEQIGYDYWISAEICNEEHGQDYHVLCGLYSISKELLGTLYKSKIKMDPNVCYIKFITF